VQHTFCGRPNHYFFRARSRQAGFVHNVCDFSANLHGMTCWPAVGACGKTPLVFGIDVCPESRPRRKRHLFNPAVQLTTTVIGAPDCSTTAGIRKRPSLVTSNPEYWPPPM
jgi:hypothetical protein